MMIYEPLPVYTAEQLNVMSEREYKTYETRLRRAAERQGLILVKSRRRDPQAQEFGLYVLVHDSAGNRRPGAQAPFSAFARGEGTDLSGIAAELSGGGQ